MKFVELSFLKHVLWEGCFGAWCQSGTPTYASETRKELSDCIVVTGACWHSPNTQSAQTTPSG